MYNTVFMQKLLYVWYTLLTIVVCKLTHRVKHQEHLWMFCGIYITTYKTRVSFSRNIVNSTLHFTMFSHDKHMGTEIQILASKMTAKWWYALPSSRSLTEILKYQQKLQQFSILSTLYRWTLYKRNIFWWLATHWTIFMPSDLSQFLCYTLLANKPSAKGTLLLANRFFCMQ